MQKQSHITFEWAEPIWLHPVSIMWLLELVLMDLWCFSDVWSVPYDGATQVVKCVFSQAISASVFLQWNEFLPTLYGTCLSVSFKYRSSQLFGNLKLLCKVFGGRKMWKLAVKISQNGFSFKGFGFFSLLNYLRVWVAIKFLLYLNFSEFLWTYTLVTMAAVMGSVVCMWHLGEV